MTKKTRPPSFPRRREPSANRTTPLLKKLGLRLRGDDGYDPVADFGSRAKFSGMKSYTITHAGRESKEPFSNYLFDVFRDGQKLAELRHDYRGDEHWMRLPGSRWVTAPERIIEGGGPEPLVLSTTGVKAMDRLTG